MTELEIGGCLVAGVSWVTSICWRIERCVAVDGRANSINLERDAARWLLAAILFGYLFLPWLFYKLWRKAELPMPRLPMKLGSGHKDQSEGCLSVCDCDGKVKR